MLPVGITHKRVGNRRSRYKRSKFSLKKCVIYLSICGVMYLCVVWMFLMVLRSKDDDVDDGTLYGPQKSLRKSSKFKEKVPLIERKNWCLETNDIYSMKDPPLLMGLGWGSLPKSMQRRWKEFKCNHIIDWTSSKENPQVWCNAVYTHTINNDMRRKYDALRCDDFIRRDRENDDVTMSGDRTFYTAQDCEGKSCGMFFSSHWHGRFGNRVFMYVYSCTYAQVHPPTVVYYPSQWEGSVLFDPNHMCVQTFESPMKELLLRT